MTEVQNKQQNSLTVADLEQKLVEVRLLRGEHMLKVLNERREQVVNSSPEKLAELEEQLSSLELTKTDELPEIAKNTIDERVDNLKNDINLIKNASLQTLERNIEELQKRVNFIKVFGI
tara:strand:- start:631 stop:987 length:357 start_codon:yes stop_codon:yes gene_type:complete